MLEKINKVRFLPVLTFVWLLITFVISYSIATSLDHVYAVWPYISDTGTTPPESCWFGIMLNIGSFLMGLVFYCQYIQVKLKLKVIGKYCKKIEWLNLFCMFLGVIMALGVCIVANFQETSDIKMHLVGANFAFGVGAGYFVLQTVLSGLLNKGDTFGFYLNIFRGILCILHITTFVTTMVFARKSLANVRGGAKEAMHFSPEMENYEFRLASTFSEWVLAICLGLYILTFTYEFKHIDYKITFHDKRLTNLESQTNHLEN